MANTWIVAADSSRARFLQVAGRGQLVEIESILNPEGRMDDRELITDAHPRFSGHGGVGKPGARSTSGPGSDRQETSAQEHATDLFAKRVGSYLDKARTKHRYDELVIIAPPKFLGTLRKELGKEVEKLVADEVPKDLSWFNVRELERYLKAGSPRP
jgi:protein required for attachment to host cells